MSRFFLLSLLCAIFLSSCTAEAHNKVSTFNFTEAIPTKGTVLNINVDLMMPRRLFLFDDELFLIDKYDGHHLTRISMRDMSCERMAISGNGPNEFIRIDALYQNTENKTICIYDNLKQVFSIYDYTRGWEFNDKTLIDNIKVLPQNKMYSLVPYKDQFVVNGIFGHQMFALLKPDFSIMGTFGRYPGDASLLGSYEFYLKNQTIIHTSEDDRCFVAAGFYNDWLSFYHEKAGKLVLQKEYFSYDSELSTMTMSTGNATQSTCVETDKTIRAYRDICSTGNYIYVLYWGVPALQMYNDGNECYVFKFNYEGELCKSYVIDGLLSTIAVDGNDEIMYAVTLADNPQLMRYDI